MKKLYITDLDGTLLGKPGELDKTGVDLLNTIIDKGVLISAATGRSLISAADILKDTKINLPIISNNGARISNLRDLKHVHSNFIDYTIAEEVLEILIEFECSPFINGEVKDKDILLFEEEINDGTKLFIDFRKEKNDPRLKNVKKYKGLNGVEVINFNIIDKTEKLENAKKVISEKYGEILDMHITFEPAWESWGWLTISDSKSNKAEGIKQLISKFIKEDVEVTVFGDQLNDIHMFEYAHRAIAVENACKELKDIADVVIGPNTENSVLKFIEKELKNA